MNFVLTQHILPPLPALEQDDKGVQVDLQDLGYETSGKSENDREESSSTGRWPAEWTLIFTVDSLYVSA